ncbi:hypothetical protein CWI75_12290 [Kineobactrum sediminis]|uniref:Uncharacterized protein n=1 Tax=Kineobactrum sediminis TaxID=1905677 RepID=A0A2N5Y2A6_9GAMM|nr:hypothetical protein [Kineobactrum sediminis]PLW82522.1 hypothetical protein CWI75_12290 [Kineobactrum sediminis]
MKTTRNHPITDSIINLLAKRTIRPRGSDISRSLPYKIINPILSGGSREAFYYNNDIWNACADHGHDARFLKPLKTTCHIKALLRAELLAETRAVLCCEHRNAYSRALSAMDFHSKVQHAVAVSELAEYPGCPNTITELAARTDIKMLVDIASPSLKNVPREICQQDIALFKAALSTGPKTSDELRTLGIQYPASVASRLDKTKFEVTTVEIADYEFDWDDQNQIAISYSLLEMGGQQ